MSSIESKIGVSVSTTCTSKENQRVPAGMSIAAMHMDLTDRILKRHISAVFLPKAGSFPTKFQLALNYTAPAVFSLPAPLSLIAP